MGIVTQYVDREGTDMLNSLHWVIQLANNIYLNPQMYMTTHACLQYSTD